MSTDPGLIKDSKIRFEVPLTPGEYSAFGSMIRQNNYYLIESYGLTLRLQGTLKLNNKIYKDPELTIISSDFLINGAYVGSTNNYLSFVIAADESSLSKYYNAAKALQEVYPTMFPPEGPACSLEAWVSPGVVLAVVSFCIFLYLVTRNIPSKYEAYEDVDPPSFGGDF